MLLEFQNIMYSLCRWLHALEAGTISVKLTNVSFKEKLIGSYKVTIERTDTGDDLESNIKKMLDEVKSDSRLKAAPAKVQINAPLALIQSSLYSRAEALRDVLKIIQEGESTVLMESDDNE